MDAVAGGICTESIAGKQELIERCRVKGSITEESFWIDQRMRTEIILKRGYQKPCIMDRFIFIRRAGFFLNDDFRMFLEKVFIVKSKMADNTKAIRNNTDFVGIAEVAINVELLYPGVGSSMGWHGSISGFIRIIIIVKVMGLCISFELFDDTVGVFGVIFRDPGFDAGRIENGHICFSRIDSLTDRFSKVNKLFENKLEIPEEILLKACDLGSIRNFVKTAELTEVPGIMEEYQKEGIRWDGKNPLDDKRP